MGLKNIRRFMLCTGECISQERLIEFPDSHIIGELRYLNDESHRISALAIYEHSRASQDVPELLPLIRCYAVGDTRSIRCTVCQRRKDWEIGKAALQVLLDRYGLII